MHVFKKVKVDRPKADISVSAENESSAGCKLCLSDETENSPKVNCDFWPNAETETESEGVQCHDHDVTQCKQQHSVHHLTTAPIMS